jgi:hypothetical protein
MPMKNEIMTTENEKSKLTEKLDTEFPLSGGETNEDLEKVLEDEGTDRDAEAETDDTQEEEETNKYLCFPGFLFSGRKQHII